MDFFEAQDRAKRNTGKLVALYLLAVVGIIVSVYFVSLLVFQTQVSVEGGVSFWQPGWLLTVSAIVLMVIITGTFFRISQLRKGGSAVAELLGGRKVNPSSTNHHERQLMNIVEEMSIASGLPVPDVYVLDKEENINAFAAGFGTKDAAVGVTRGALEQLNRDELQGVIAHEFSHIFNGDMRLNIRLIGILNGILLIHIMGMIVMRSALYSGAMRGGNRGGKGNSALPLILFGVSLIIIGYIGMIFGRMIQSAISRQREFLADAAAVQYTRNPDGLAGALNKIEMKKKGAEIKDGHAMEMSHLFFASSFHSALDALFATHPPIEQRIKAIKPSLDSKDRQRQEKMKQKFKQDHVSGGQSSSADRGVGGHAALTPEVILGAIGTMSAGNVQQAGKLLQDIPADLREAAHEPLTAEALLIALLISSRKNENTALPEWFVKDAGKEMVGHIDNFIEKLTDAKREWYLALAELALPALRHMSKSQYKKFRSQMERLVQEDKTENIFSFALEKMVLHQLDSAFSDSKRPDVKHHSLRTLGKELSVLLSILAHESKTGTEEAWNAALEPIKIALPDDMALLERDQCTIKELDMALDELDRSANPVKKYILSAVIHCVTSDNQITTDEKELVRAISEALECPIPLGAMG